MTYQETIDYLYSRLPLFSRIGAAAIKKDLDNTIEICQFLGQPQEKFKIIHVAGTNGKGSTSHMLASIFQCAGYKTGLYTSPHLFDFRERIKVNGELCSKDFVIDFTKKVTPLIEKIEPSFFEITVGMAFDYFGQQECDIAIIETGLGGRLDSTNIVHPIISVITNIGWDHMALLGDTLDKIAFEKAGIIKENTPVVIGTANSITMPVFQQRANELHATLFDSTTYFKCMDYQNKIDHGIFQFDWTQEYSSTIFPEQLHLETDLPGIYQKENIATVLTTMEALSNQGLAIAYKHIQQGIEQAKHLTGLHGRWECISKEHNIIADVAHNVDGVQQVLKQLETCEFKQLHIITGMVKDKDIDAVLTLLPKDATYYFTQSHIPRALEKEALATKAATHQLIGKVYENVNDALLTAKDAAANEDLILVMGSVFLVAEVKALNDSI
jgi:dihydrofolate synthase/folylpolyglutamate synthase